MLKKNGLKLLWNWFWLFITWKNEQKNLYVILVYAWDTAQLMGESTRLVCVQLMERDFENVFNKSDGDFRQLQYKNQIQRDVHCTKKILGWHCSILMFSYTRHFSSVLILGFILFSENKMGAIRQNFQKLVLDYTKW